MAELWLPNGTWRGYGNWGPHRIGSLVPSAHDAWWGRAVAFRPSDSKSRPGSGCSVDPCGDTLPGGRGKGVLPMRCPNCWWSGPQDFSHFWASAGRVAPACRCSPQLKIWSSALRRLLQDGHLNDQPRKGLLALQLLDTARNSWPCLKGKFLGELRHYFWQPVVRCVLARRHGEGEQNPLARRAARTTRRP